MKNQKDTPRGFAFNEVCAFSIQAGIAHLKNVYKEKDIAKRKEWRREVQNKLKNERECGYSADNIERIRQFIEATADDKILQNGKLTFGVAQKILNLFLKYCWSLDWITNEPPDCPIDSRILSKLKWNGNPWSKMNENDYNDVMKRVEKESKTKNLSRAMWELKEWEKLR